MKDRITVLSIDIITKILCFIYYFRMHNEKREVFARIKGQPFQNMRQGDIRGFTSERRMRKICFDRKTMSFFDMFFRLRVVFLESLGSCIIVFHAEHDPFAILV